MKVFKFGGSSVKNADAIKRVATIIEGHPDCSLVVVSATQNTTNELEQIAKLALTSKKDSTDQWGKTLQRHVEIGRELELDIEFELISKEVELLIEDLSELGEFSKMKMDQLYSIGERLSSYIISKYLSLRLEKSVNLLDARDYIITNDEFSKASPLVKEILKKDLSSSSGQLYITQGFIGSTAAGVTTTLGREGSDFSATLFGELLNCSEVIIWTDVCGVATCDPRIIKGAQYIEKMSYDQAALLAHLGAKVLFERTLEPAQRAGFQVVVKSTLLPERPGTKISSAENGDSLIAMSIKEDIVSVVGNHLITNKCLDEFTSENSEYKIHEQNEKFFSMKISKQHMSDYLQRIHSLILKCHHNE